MNGEHKFLIPLHAENVQVSDFRPSYKKVIFRFLLENHPQLRCHKGNGKGRRNLLCENLTCRTLTGDDSPRGLQGYLIVCTIRVSCLYVNESTVRKLGAEISEYNIIHHLRRWKSSDAISTRSLTLLCSGTGFVGHICSVILNSQVSSSTAPSCITEADRRILPRQFRTFLTSLWEWNWAGDRNYL